jgi:hypothetical protein
MGVGVDLGERLAQLLARGYFASATIFIRRILMRSFAAAMLSLLISVPIVAKKAPPLIVEPNRYSYTFGVPTGWEFSFEEGKQFGLRLVFFPHGGDFHTANTVIYVNEVCPSNCTGTLTGTIQQTIDNAKRHSPNLKVEAAKPIPISTGGEASIRILSGSRDVRQAREAMAFIEHKETVVLVVLTTKNISTWESDYKAFEAIVKGHKYFNCDSPELAVKCR